MREVTENYGPEASPADNSVPGRSERLEIPESLAGQRVDKALVTLLEGTSRARIQQWIGDGLVLLDDEAPRQKDKVTGGELVEIWVPSTPAGEWQAEDIPLEIVHEDDHIIVVDKPAGLVVHPGAGNSSGTLLNALLFRDEGLRSIPRAGIVHRLDKDTTGLMVVARTETARLDLVEQLSLRNVHREYLALVVGRVIAGGTVNEPVGRDPRDRRRMSVNPAGKEAITHFRIAERFRGHTLLQVTLGTGRTHQIRVHMRHVGFPLVGDRVYGNRLAIPRDCLPALESELRNFRRQALHARSLGFRHPATGADCKWEASPHADMLQLLEALRLDEARTRGS